MDEIIKTFGSNVSFPFKFSIFVDSPATLCALPTGDTSSRGYLKSVSLGLFRLNASVTRTLLTVEEYCV